MDRAHVYLSMMATDAGAFNFEHYGQLIHTKGPQFNRFDHGKIQNMWKYGQMHPPSYNLKNI